MPLAKQTEERVEHLLCDVLVMVLLVCFGILLGILHWARWGSKGWVISEQVQGF